MENLSFKTVALFSAVLCLIQFETVPAANVTVEGRTPAKPRIAEEEGMPTLGTVVEQWENMDRRFKSVASGAINELMRAVLQRNMRSNVSSTCMRQALKFIAGLRNSKAWAFSLLDASGKSVDGLFSGSLTALGEYDQCLNTQAINGNSGVNYGKVMFTGKYCAVEFRPPLPPKNPYFKIHEVLDEFKNLSKKGTVAAEASKNAHFFYFLAIRFGICVPSGCSENDISQVLKSALQNAMWSANVKRCEVMEETKITPTIIFVGSVYGILVLLVILGTAVDVVYYYRKQEIQRKALVVLTTFSFFSNFRKLIKTGSSTEHLQFISGVKVLTIVWVVYSHTHSTINLQAVGAFKEVVSYGSDFAFQIMMNGNLAADTFFFLSGLLLCYVTIKVVKGMNKPFNIPFFIFHRFWRITPLYACVILLFFLGPIAGSGPLWHDTVDKHFNSCYRNWWLNLLYLNNFFRTEELCLLQSWYVASDMQLYLFSPIVLIPLVRWPKVGFALAALCIFVSIMVSSLITYLNDLPPTMLFVYPDSGSREEYLRKIYYTPYFHAGPYFIGVLVGYLLATGKKIRFSKMVLAAGWCAAIACNMSVLYGVYDWNKGRKATLFESIIYSGFHKTAWALGLAWISVCCAAEQGGIVNYILTWRSWIPISRLTYSVYLVHPLIQHLYYGSLRTKLGASHVFMVWLFFGHLMVSYGVAFVLSMIIEAPCFALEKVLLHKKKSDEDSSIRKSNNIEATAADSPIARSVSGDLTSFCNGTPAENKAFQL